MGPGFGQRGEKGGRRAEDKLEGGNNKRWREQEGRMKGTLRKR